MTAAPLPLPVGVGTGAAPAARARRALIPGIGEPLPAGETLLWTGGPERRAIARHVCHTRGVALYFAALFVFLLLGGSAPGGAARSLVAGSALLALMAAAVLGFAYLYAVLVARTTVYAITDRRLVLRIGVAIPAVLNIPFDRIASVDVRAGRDGSGDVMVALTGRIRVAYLLLWPHARPWHYTHPQPALRGLPDAVEVGTALANAVVAATASSAAAEDTAEVQEVA